MEGCALRIFGNSSHRVEQKKLEKFTASSEAKMSSAALEIGNELGKPGKET